MNAKPWLVLTATDPRHVEYRLGQKNMEEEQDGNQPCFRYFVPYTFLSPNHSEGDLSKSNFSLRSALHRYLFVEGDDAILESLIREWNRTSEDKVFFLRDASSNKAQISQQDMDKLVAACSDEEVRLDMPLSLHDLKAGDEFSLVNTPFAKEDTTYRLLSVRRRKGGLLELQVELRIFNIPFRNLFVTYPDTSDSERNASLVSAAQKKLLDIFRRRVNRKETDVTRYQDRKTLEAIYEQRDTPFPDGAMKRHFLALMLICAHLSGNEEGKARLTEAVRRELADIARLRESKAATDTRAYLHVALYIATGEPKYRELAKTYVQKHNPQSPYLRQFVSTSAKRQAAKFLGTARKD